MGFLRHSIHVQRKSVSLTWYKKVVQAFWMIWRKAKWTFNRNSVMNIQFRFCSVLPGAVRDAKSHMTFWVKWAKNKRELHNVETNYHFSNVALNSLVFSKISNRFQCYFCSHRGDHCRFPFWPKSIDNKKSLKIPKG